MFLNRDYLKHKEELMEEFDGKCSYCDSRIGLTSHGNIEHYYPNIYTDTHLKIDQLPIVI